MKKIIYSTAVIILIAMNTLYAAQPYSQSIAFVNDFHGDSTIKQGAAASWSGVYRNMPVYEGDEVMTSTGSYVEIVFDDATIIRLDQNSTLKVTQLQRDNLTGISKTVFNLTIGKLLAVVNKLTNSQSSFEIHTKMAIAAVKGTSLDISALDNGSLLGVFEGAVKFTDANGNNPVTVGEGNESGTDANGKPETPAGLKRLLADADTLKGLKDAIEKIRHDRANGKNANNGGSDRQEELDGMLRDEIRSARQKDFRDMKFADNEVKADQLAGKTMMDVNGDRVRFEEYIVRPEVRITSLYNNFEVIYYNFTSKNGKIDSMIRDFNFDYSLPDVIPANYWYSFWDASTYPAGPDNYKLSEQTTYSNSQDTVVQFINYNLMDASNWTESTTPGKVLTESLEYLTVNGNYKEYSTFYDVDSSSYTYGYFMLKDPYYDLTFANDPGTHATFTPYSEVVTGNSAYNTGITKYYNDGSNLSFNYSFINNYGKSILPPQNYQDLLNIAETTNVELQITSSDFQLPSIEIVSKYLWWTYLNPENTDENRASYIDNVP